MDTYKIALIGNQNSGKTTLFNTLTGSTQHIGNFPGITLEKKEGTWNRHSNIHIIDLPGIYSLTSYTIDEIVATNYLLQEKPDVIINIVDATNLERNMYLTMQLLELEIPIIIVLNMIDVVIKNNQRIDIHGISKMLGVPVVAISAQKKQGIDVLYAEVNTMLTHKTIPSFKYPNDPGYFDEAIQIIASKNRNCPYLYCALQVLEDETEWKERLSLTKQDVVRLTALRKVIEKTKSTDIQKYIIQTRYEYIGLICQKMVHKPFTDTTHVITNKIDAILTHKYFGIPIFLAIMLTIFYLTFHVLGAPLQNMLEQMLQIGTDILVNFMVTWKVAPWLIALIQDGIFAGVGSVLSFLPVIMLLFLFLSLLEDTGYMARVAFLMDALLQKIGLSGKSFVPLILGFGCSVPAILATRTLPSERDRKITMILVPFISCSAKLPIYSLIVNAFFPQKAAITMLLMYGLGIFVAIFIALLLKSKVFIGESVPFLMELPTYRFPTIKSIQHQVQKRAVDFIKKAFTIIFLASIILWFLQSFNLQFQYISNANESILAKIGYTIAWIFKPMGCHDWRLSTSLFTGIIAKESVVSTLTVLSKATSDGQLLQSVTSMLTPASALSFLTFTVLYVPCAATIATLYKELHSLKETISIVIFQTGIAYLVAYIVYCICNMLV